MAKKTKKKKSLGQELKELAWLLLGVLILRTMLFQPFVIPSGSMYPTLMVGDYIIVNKYTYGYSKYSVLLGGNLPDFGRLWATKPTQGQVIVFREVNSKLDYIKRLIGMPGDTIQYKQGRLYINGKIIPRKRLDDTLYEGKMVRTYEETLPNGVKYRIYETMGNRGPLDNTPVFEVPENHYFMMGDNRDQSADSRVYNVGFVHFDALLGPARLIVLSFEDGILKFWKWFSGARTNRFFTKVQ